jgi:hypothetical protein
MRHLMDHDPMTRPRTSARWLAFLALAAGCEAFYSDSENFSRRARAEHDRRVAGMRAATAETPAGGPVVGDALRTLLQGRTHVSEYGFSPGGKHERYVEYHYFAADGRFVYTNTSWATDPNGRPGDTWRVDGPRLCIVNQSFGPDAHCYTIAVTPAGHVQYFIDQPGADTHGLLTREVTIVTDGPPRPGAR